ncbi:MAG: hypothetical protein E6Q97_09705 [Desulfurellales bacterium]|nr:MAG: hypothetical protein E6Q97_09705 [Desulfurellales bacterium]
MAINRRTLSRELKEIEGNVSCDFIMTRQAIKLRKPDADVMDAMMLDIGQFFTSCEAAEKQVMRFIKSQTEA